VCGPDAPVRTPLWRAAKRARMIDIDRNLGIPVIELDLGPFSVTEPMLDAIAVDLLDVLANIDPPLVILDLGPTHHLGSKAISVLVRAWRDLMKRRGRLVFCRMNAYSREVLRTLQLDRHWEIYTTREEALYAIQPKAKKPVTRPSVKNQPSGA
jgi:anti-anti-sigma regulatory factor